MSFRHSFVRAILLLKVFLDFLVNSGVTFLPDASAFPLILHVDYSLPLLLQGKLALHQFLWLILCGMTNNHFGFDFHGVINFICCMVCCLFVLFVSDGFYSPLHDLVVRVRLQVSILLLLQLAPFSKLLTEYLIISLICC